jgi:molybdopterin-guanine dinucleotide biosynthesis adapter protein
MNKAKVLGIVGWSGSGKTTLIIQLIPELNRRGLRVATLKHAHHNFDVDKPGKDSYEHRKAGASEVIVSSALRWAQMHEVGNGQEATLAVASDQSLSDASVPVVDLNNVEAVADLVYSCAESMDSVLATLGGVTTM